MARDPFEDAVCRQPAADARWWDVDATPADRQVAANLCRACPALYACTLAALDAGAGASGTWAGVWRPWTEPDVVDQDHVSAYKARDERQSGGYEQMSLEELIG